MTEEEAKAWLRQRWPERMEALEAYVALLLDEADRQSLIAPSTYGSVWSRHVVDSAQLLRVGAPEQSWLDVGSGGGLPGIVLAILGADTVTLVEPRRRRAEFLKRCCDMLGLTNAVVEGQKVEAVHGGFDIVTARAVASPDALFTSTEHLVSRETLYLLPRGRSGADDIRAIKKRWAGKFHVERSETDPESWIVVANGVRRR